jgi:hypothetical protein
VPALVISSVRNRLRAGRLPLPLAIDWLLITGLTFLFAKPLLDLDPNLTIAGRESESNTDIIAVAKMAFREHGEFPFWNPFLNTGTPYISDPMTHLFNPLASVPGLVLGPVSGPKVAVFLTILVSGLAFYYLTTVLDIWRPIRIWAALAYAFNGHMAARFDVGHFDFVLAFAFLPLAVAFTIQTARRPGGVYPFLGGLSVALVLFSGNVYYTVFLIPAVVLAALFYLLSTRSGRPWLSLDARAVVRLAAMGFWTLGIVSVQLIPYFQVQDYMYKPSDPLLKGSQPVVGSLLNFVQSDREFFRSDSYGKIAGFMNEYYSYVGWAPYVGVLLLPLALARGRHRSALFAGSLFALYIAWASAAHTPFRYVMDLVPWLYKLRWTSRLLGPATLPLILLAALGFDGLRSTYDFKMAGLGRFRQHRWLAAFLATPLVLAAGVFLALALKDEYQANRGFFRLVPRNQADQDIAVSLDTLNDEAAFVTLQDDRGGLPLAYYEHRLQRLKAPWAWDMKIQVPEGGDVVTGEGAFIPRPHFLVLLLDTVPEEADAQFVEEVGKRKIYRLPKSLPMAFTTRSVDPPFGQEPTWESKASKAVVYIRSSNRLDVEAEPQPGEDTLVLLQTHFPGWKVKVDGTKTQTVSNLGGYLATPAVAGRHTYSFVFDPAPQRYGLAISGGTMLGACLLYAFEGRRRVAAGLGCVARALVAVRNLISLLRRAK